MLSLVSQYKGRVLSLNEFMMRSRELLGERLYAQLARDMSNAAAARGAAVSNNPTPLQQPSQAGGIKMHSMPQIYSGIQAPGIPNISFLPQQPVHPGQYPHYPQQVNEIDVTKMDTSSLQDVMQYSGVDLKAEAELLYREHHDNNNNMMASGLGSLSVDHRLKFDYFFNPFKFRAIVQHALQRHFFSNNLVTTSGNSVDSSQVQSSGKMNKPLGISEEAVHLLGIAIQKRLIGVLRKLSEISKHRVDYGRGRFKIKIENDPKKQIWLQEKLFIEGVGEEHRRAVAYGNGNCSGNANNSSSNTSNNVNQTLLNPPSLATIAASVSANKSTGSVSGGKAAGAGGAAASSNSGNAAAGDESVKTKLANVTAMAALGIRQKSWMSSASALNSNTSSTSLNSASTNSNTASNSTSQPGNGDEKDSTEVNQHPLANFYSLPSSTPLTDSELRSQYFNRTISTVDLITCMESDSHLRRSKLLAVLYEALPRENKDNYPSETQQK